MIDKTYNNTKRRHTKKNKRCTALFQYKPHDGKIFARPGIGISELI
jgi:hypothetical protein